MQASVISCASRRAHFTTCGLYRCTQGISLRQGSSVNRSGRQNTRTCLVPAAAGIDQDGPELVPISEAGSLDGSSEEAFGPLAALVIGLTIQQVSQFRHMMSELEADMVQVVPCTRALLQQPLATALGSSAQAEQEEPLVGQKRMVILSGMYSSEVFSIMAGYKDAGLPECVWAAAVPANMETRLSQLVDDVYGDHNYMQAQHA